MLVLTGQVSTKTHICDIPSQTNFHRRQSYTAPKSGEGYPEIHYALPRSPVRFPPKATMRHHESIQFIPKTAIRHPEVR